MSWREQLRILTEVAFFVLVVLAIIWFVGVIW